MIGVCIGAQKFCSVASFHQIDGNEFIRPGLAWRCVMSPGRNFEAVETMEYVAQPSPVIDLLAHRFAKFAVVWNGNSDVVLMFHDARDGRLQKILKHLF